MSLLAEVAAVVAVVLPKVDVAIVHVEARAGTSPLGRP